MGELRAEGTSGCPDKGVGVKIEIMKMLVCDERVSEIWDFNERRFVGY